MERMPSGARLTHLRRPASTPLTMHERSQRRPPSSSRGLLAKRWTSWIVGRASFQRRSETRQLSAPRSTAMDALRSFGCSGRAGVLFIVWLNDALLAKERVGESSVDRNDVAGGAGRLRTGEEKDSLGAVAGIDGHMRQGALGIEGRELVAELVIGLRLLEGDVVLGQRGLDAITREHGGTLDHRRRADAVDTDAGRVGDGELADEMAESGLGDVVCLG